LDPYIDRDLATSTRSNRGVTAFGIYPLSRYSRVEMSAGFAYIKESINNQDIAGITNPDQQQPFGQSNFRTGWYAPLTVAFVQETTVFREFGPLTGSTMRASYQVAPPITKGLSWQSVDGDVRKYIKIGSTGLFALRAKGFKSWGSAPSYTYFGGNSEMRGYDYLQFVGQNAFFANAELRFSLIDAIATPIGILGGVRGVFFANMGGAWFDGSGYKFSTSQAQVVTPITYTFNPVTGAPIPIYGDPIAVSGFRLVDGRASYGFGLTTFALGFPIHFDWAWRTLLNKPWEDAVFAASGGSAAFRKGRFQWWIGYDF
jgi:outer membrane protein assembly factor BamA